ncbi:DUF1697 domain-containing protein [Gordonia terrae]|uniref:DUF1697 domain-containing protein n=2 Tax=Gordonia terrae TaxID=2055 RepID=A0AAD0NWK5_9ACTN|nr:DUF1697 domain-containing protein [Gordonia terrae]ANY22521.1 hypothetical protein BCM27_06630 [Gordonia terrae]AWO83257.1 DUF1697 domain-containing protein [Gordonia terrae]
MRTHVAFLGGVNLGARNRISMSDLRGVAESMGLTDVVTYIQSGNLVFTSCAVDVTELAGGLENRIGERLDVPPRRRRAGARAR